MTLVCSRPRCRPRGPPTAQCPPGSADCRSGQQNETERTETDQNTVALVQYRCCLSGLSRKGQLLNRSDGWVAESPLRPGGISTGWMYKGSHRQADSDRWRGNVRCMPWKTAALWHEMKWSDWSMKEKWNFSICVIMCNPLHYNPKERILFKLVSQHLSPPFPSFGSFVRNLVSSCWYILQPLQHFLFFSMNPLKCPLVLLPACLCAASCTSRH